mmetsp:Transcript_2334/g.3678  ORF Transcript_2334/g.3678 Transcript_2334/m.3678 type:complete len:211 (+) Transcript_2334:29-661(+)|eukprot:CAMPEP_0174978422 /NCGR_PEP_ID=MMETSP0004_2-20121128/14194_1 /TAXON_ID=420556 /ORGANISM="Ochromonas sp., Strain CCMP1393" /LENGTH=210 /DNA_ID=CAMNT_0016229791 /DNA_START=29 /DNA_END=661 /DNA_ORIENTATION=+
MTSPYRLPITSVVAVTPSWGIGNRGTLPWHCVDKHLPKDLAYFREATTHTTDVSKRNAVLMGRITWESIPEKNRPLKNRINFIISKTLQPEIFTENPNVFVATSLDEALEMIERNARLRESVEKAVVVGGARLFDESLFHDWFDTLHLTQIHTEFESDTFLPERTCKYLQQQDLNPYVVHDNIIEDDVPYRIVELPVKGAAARSIGPQCS